MAANLRKYLVEAVKVAGVAAAVLAVAGPVLAGLHVPASDLAIVATVMGALAAFRKWAADNGITPKSVLGR